jgi:Uma2 family endonuclease
MNLQPTTQNQIPPITPVSNGGTHIYYPESDGKPMAETYIHINLIIYLKTALEIFFAEREDVYVTGNIMFYYIEDELTQCVSPDVMVCFGVPKHQRRTYKLWEENDVPPAVVIEISSCKTWRDDRVKKVLLYAQLGVPEYYIFNPEKITKKSTSFLAYRLEDSQFEPVHIHDGRVRSEILGLDLVETGSTLRLFNPQTNQILPTVIEINEDNQRLTAENAVLQAEIERLKTLL